MPFNAREVLLIIRASDQASRVLAGVGRAFTGVGREANQGAIATMQAGQQMMSLGAGMLGIGLAGAAGFGMAMKASADFTKEARLTLSQVDQVGASLQDIKNIAIRVAKDIPAPFKQMQKTLFDIFSSMDVNTKQAESLLRQFSKAAVAGNVDIQVAGRATMAIMNAFKIPVEDVSKVMDFQFQLVRKGVGTYQEFATTIGRAIPSAVRAGQSVETLGGMLAFLTRNGLSAASASASAGRALDAMAKPVVAERLQEIGIAVRDASGNFRPLVDVVRDMNEHFGKMTAPDRAKALDELFKGAGGTIQARRFFDTVFKNFDEFEQRVDEMGNATGAMGKAFSGAANDADKQWQLFSNNIEILKVTVGDVLMPAFNKVLSVVTKFLQVFGEIPQPIMIAITVFGALSSVLMIVMGAITMAAGAFLVMGSTLGMLGITWGIFLGAIAGTFAILAALIAVGYLLIRNWDTIKMVAGLVWGWVVTQIQNAWNSMRPFFDWVANTFGPGITEIWNKIKEVTSQLKDEFIKTWNELFAGITLIAESAWIWISGVFDGAFTIIKAIVQGAIAWIVMVWQHFGDNVLVILRTVWAMIVEVLKGALHAIAGMIKTVLAIMRGDWGAAWDGIKQALRGAWDMMVGIVLGSLKVIGELIKSLVTDLPGFFGDAAGILVGIGKKIIEGLIKGIKGMFGGVKNVLGDLGSSIVGWKGPPAKDAVMLINNGQLIMEGLIRGISNRFPEIRRVLKDAQDLFLLEYGSPDAVMRAATGAVTGAITTAGANAGSQTRSTTVTIAEGAIQNVITAEADLEQVKLMMEQQMRELVRAIRQATNGA